jgi:PAS domain S-box-containing protein
MATDITEQVEAQQALERQEAQFRQLHQSLGEVLWLAGIDGQPLIYVSPAFETVYGRPVADFRANLALWLDCVVPEDRARAAASSLELAARGRSSCEYRIRRPDGSLRWLSDRKRSITDENGKVVMIGGIAEDITATKERDAARATTQAQLEAMVAERTAALERVNAELDSFARTAAHDMKSPLNAIAGFSQIVQHKYGAQLGAEGRRMVALIEQSALDMATLINDLLSLSRMTAAELRLADVDLAELGREIIDTFRQHEPHRVVSFDAPPNLAVRCDAGLARSLMTNLLGNAWKFTNRREQAAIRLTVSDTCRGAVFSIEDNGAGFDPAQADRLFKPFQRLHSVADFSGTGLGLVTCQRIVQRHGGAIWAQARPGQGATFHFTMAAPPAASHGVEAVPMAGTAAREPDVGTRDGELLIAPAAD